MKKFKLNIPKITILFLIVILMFAFVGCSPVEKQFFAFGTYSNVKLEKGKISDTMDYIESEFLKLDKKFDTEKENSDLFKINIAKENEIIDVSADTYNLIMLAKILYEKTNGAFNIATYPLTELWQMSPEKYQPLKNEFIPPTAKQIENTLKNCDLDDLELLKNNKIVKHNGNLKISFGALAKGYAGNLAYKKAIENENKGFINVGGTIFVCNDTKNIGIAHPRSNENVLGVVKASGGTVFSTSGDYERYYLYENKRYHHIFDVNGYPAKNGVISATVLGSVNNADGSIFDALSTAVVALGLEDGKKLITEYGLSAIIVTENKNCYLINMDNFELTLKDTSYKCING